MLQLTYEGGGEMPKYWGHFVDQTEARLKFILDPTSINLSKHVNRSDPVARRGGENNTIYKGYYVDSAAGQRRHSARNNNWARQRVYGYVR